MQAHEDCCFTLDPRLTALALRGLRQEPLLYPFLERAVWSRRVAGLLAPVGRTQAAVKIRRLDAMGS